MTTTTTRIISKVFSRSYTMKSHCFHSTISRLRPLAASLNTFKQISPIVRGFATGVTYNSDHDSWSTNPTYERNLEIGRDLEHWLVVVNRPMGFREEKIDSYIKTLATVVGSEEEARMKIYSVSTEHHYAFGALVSEELAKIMEGNHLALPLRRNSRKREYMQMNQLEGSPGNLRCPHCNMEVCHTGGPSGEMGGFPPERGSTPYIGAIPPNNTRGHGIISEGCNKITLGVRQVWSRCKTATWDIWKVPSGTGKK